MKKPHLSGLLPALWLLLPASVAASTPADGLLLDGPRGPGLAPALATAWLLDDGASAPPSSWPLPRRHWLASPASPTLAWQARSRPWLSDGDTLRPAGLASLEAGALRAALDPRLESAGWRFGDEARGELGEAGNGVEGEALFGPRAAFWLHFRDNGLSGDVAMREHPLYREDESWLWSQIGSGGELTHDESRAGGTLTGELGASGRWQLSLLREHLRWGVTPGRSAQIQGDRAPSVPQLQLALEAGSFRFVQTVGELFSGLPDSLARRPDPTGSAKLPWREKWLVAHRLEWSGRDLAIGAGEAVVIGDRRPGPGYLIPANFFWSEQHAQGDQDNTLLFADLRWRLPAALPGAWMLAAEIAIDDYSLSDFGDELEGQKYATAWAVDGCPLPVWRRPDGAPAGLEIGAWRLPGISWIGWQQTRARPYFGSHFLASNRFDHGDASFGPFEDPNSRAVELRWRHEWSAAEPVRVAGLRCDPLLILSADRFHAVHGANPIDPFVNVGGDRELPHRERIDVQEARFLAGNLETRDGWALGLRSGLHLATAGGRALGVLRLDIDWTTQVRSGPAVSDASESLLGWRVAWSRGL